MNDYKAYNTIYLIGLYQMEARATFHVHFTGIYTQTMKFPPRTLILVWHKYSIPILPITWPVDPYCGYTF